ncbi:hypothetical protein JGH11_08645 [Dysgonomonas sp. Marseille-P4677]|uniref:hypothetical protein n=1 Tax=Dysgonomonas sp. Marseille-P4677 TaxID=2364790 RepID=UPI001914418E|nr:hypothetical protein [Dysgonomonas sp. Marseille-P4677]MBK5720937.1 hypothetical protein [Dysgonomonas sp. Marseille-P4677]
MERIEVNQTKIKPKIIFTFIACILYVLSIQAQVTIGSNEAPQKYSILEIISTANNPGGLRLPHFNEADKTALNADLLASPEKSKGLLIYNTDKNQVEFWDGTQWIAAKGGDSITIPTEPWLVSGTTTEATSNTENIYQMGNIGIGTKNPQNTFHVDGAKDNSTTPTATEVANDFIITSTGSVGIGTISPDASAILDINASSKGFLGPKVALQSSTDVITIPNPAVGLLIYNKGTGALKTEGYLYWNGTEWVQFTTGSSKDPEIANLDCINARIVPSRYQAGVKYEGVLIVPYSGGNGGRYASGTPTISTGVTGLTATLQPANLAYGNGDLIFSLSGIPSASSPNLASFNVDFLGYQCTAIVGSNAMMQGEQTFWRGSMPADVYGTTVLASNYINDMPVIEDVFRMDAQFSATSTSTGGATLNPRMYNISEEPVKIWASSMSSQEGFGYSNIIIPAGGYIEFDNGVYLHQGSLASTTPSSGRLANNGQETVTIDMFYNGKWFRLYYTIWVDNKKANVAANMTRELYLSIQRLY